MKKIIIIAVIFVLCLCSAGMGYVYGGSNLTLSRYPEFSALRPSKPYGKNRYDAERYQNDVISYRRQAQEYLNNAENDVKRINEAVNDTVEQVNSVVNEYNYWVNSGY